jgi:hypothetical protein
MFPRKLGITEEAQEAADLAQVANALMKHEFFEDVPLDQLENRIRVSYIDAPPL